jgi:hypothetical protein
MQTWPILEEAGEYGEPLKALEQKAAIPEDGVGVPWKLIVYSPEPVSVCGLRTGGAG